MADAPPDVANARRILRQLQPQLAGGANPRSEAAARELLAALADEFDAPEGRGRPVGAGISGRTLKQ
eukprot:1876429-Pyramimonas_sp.AAC.1